LTNITALNWALEQKCPIIVNYLMTDVNVNIEDRNNSSLFEKAAKHLNVGIMAHFLIKSSFKFKRYLVKDGVALNLFLHSVVLDDLDIEYLRTALKKGARIRYGTFGFTALRVAAELGRAVVLEVLLDELSKDEIERDINAMCTTVHADIQREYYTPLAIAAVKGHDKIVKLLVRHGADMDVRVNGRSVANLAREEGQSEVWALLREVEDRIRRRKKKTPRRRKRRKRKRMKRRRVCKKLGIRLGVSERQETTKM
jgi:ankyrin repeat protein